MSPKYRKCNIYLRDIATRKILLKIKEKKSEKSEIIIVARYGGSFKSVDLSWLF